MERTLVLLKPDTVQRGLIGSVLTRLEQRGLRIAALKLMQITPDLAAEHYRDHVKKPFYKDLVQFITSGPVVAAVVEGRCAVEVVRKTMGDTNPALCAPGTIRGDFGMEIGHNLIHGSDGEKAAEREVGLFFRPEEILSYRRAVDDWIEDRRSDGS